MKQKLVMLIDTGMQNYMIFERIDSELVKERKSIVKVRKMEPSGTK